MLNKKADEADFIGLFAFMMSDLSALGLHRGYGDNIDDIFYGTSP